jgi:hypothetical protein
MLGAWVAFILYFNEVEIGPDGQSMKSDGIVRDLRDVTPTLMSMLSINDGVDVNSSIMKIDQRRGECKE